MRPTGDQCPSGITAEMQKSHPRTSKMALRDFTCEVYETHSKYLFCFSKLPINGLAAVKKLSWGQHKPRKKT